MPNLNNKNTDYSLFKFNLAFKTNVQLIGYSLCIDKIKILGQGCLFDLKFFKTPLVNLCLNVKL